MTVRRSWEGSVFALWRDAALLQSLVRAEHLTTARCEPILRASLGSAHVDLLFEATGRSCVLSGLRLDANNLVTRERSPFVWPASVLRTVDEMQLEDLERHLTPWLRSISRARSMSTESTRSFTSSERFERARSLGLVGAAPLEQTVPRMAPFVYARRFAAGAHVRIDCADASLAYAVLADVAAVIELPAARDADEAFAAAWYAVAEYDSLTADAPDVSIVDARAAADADTPVVIELKPAGDSRARRIDVPSPAPWDLLFSFDAADAPPVSWFRVAAVESPLREFQPPAPARRVGGSSGTIVLAVSPEALAMRGADIEEAHILRRRLAAEGFAAELCAQTNDAALNSAQLVHIFGSAFEPHTIAFGEFARQRGTPFVFDLAPRPATPSGSAESDFSLLFRAGLDDAMVGGYEAAYFSGDLVIEVPASEPSAEDHAGNEVRFAELTRRASAVIVAEEDIELVRAALPPDVGTRIVARGVFADDEPVPEPVAHFVPRAPFAFAHATIAARSHALLFAVAAERGNLPLVIAGPMYDVEYLQALGAAAPSAIVLPDANPGVTSALYRRAAVWVDAAPRPRSAAWLLRAVACGALPLLAANSPLTRIAGDAAPVFSATSIDACTRALSAAFNADDREKRIAALQARLLPRRDPAGALGAVLSAYLRSAVSV